MLTAQSYPEPPSQLVAEIEEAMLPLAGKVDEWRWRLHHHGLDPFHIERVVQDALSVGAEELVIVDAGPRGGYVQFLA